ncbi:developmental checkpoint coupling sporulation initiation to replication initiation [Paenibacillus catalpae]|uniref:Developmental checkpoint coupling sporulation initiation to replication initiation n=1 Tax=Paenibacillus catalpae TaxID=1045775 RepID=A0A1I1Y880_9BACL|nr:sporulation histidine kinase inhibitor Sda [Paenibacillus catalpae]SFE15774.1 developmental checkpoint coupling sporulation initiation to replication initiation [Paenibacillus catalpae]
MELLSDELLEDTYLAAIQYNLEDDFIRMLLIEMKRRQLNKSVVSNVV